MCRALSMPAYNGLILYLKYSTWKVCKSPVVVKVCRAYMKSSYVKIYIALVKKNQDERKQTEFP